MAHKFNFGQKFLVWTSSLIMISILIPLTAEVAKASCPLPSLVTNQSFPSGANNQGAAVGDVNNDGKLDIVTTNNIQPNNQISVMLGIGDGTFQSPVNTTTENGGTRIVLADFNNDTKLDVAITINQASGVIAVHLGNGNGTFGFSDIFSAGNFPASIHSADFNNDGKRDIVFTGKTVANGIDHFGVMFGTGTGIFGTPTYYTFDPQGMTDTLPIDINQDNFIDLVATRSDQLSYPFINNGNGTFTGLTPTSSIDGSNGRFSVPTSAAIGDFNADGRNEVAVGYRSGFFALARVGIIFRNGASNAQQPFVLRDWYRVWNGSGGPGDYVSDIAAADFNGDGRSDLAFLETGTQSISIQLDTTVITNGTSSPPINAEQRIGDNATSYYAGVSPRQVLTGDFNNDGKIDLAIRDENGSTMQILLNSGAGRFKAAFRPFVITAGAFELDESKNDLNGDGLTDLVGVGGSTLSPFSGSIKGNFKNTALRAIDDNILNPFSIFRISLGDFDGDGKKDIVGAGITSSNGLRFLHGNGDGTFTDSNNSTNQGVQYYSTAAGDFNSDNKLDAVAITNTNIGLFRGNGQGVFFSPINFPAGTDLRFIVSQDFNGDGKPDVAATDFAANRVVVLLGNGTAGFGTPVNFTVGTNPTKLALADFNTDGKIDIVTANEGSNNVSVLLGNGMGGFGTATNFAIGVKPVWVTSGDINNDGKLDLLTANHDANSVSILLGNGDGIFNAPSNITYNMTRPTTVTLQDTNFDGRPDLITGMNRFQDDRLVYSMSVILNSCDANPTAPRTRFDYDGDGKTDLSIFRPAPGEWWINRSSTSQTFAVQFGQSTDKIAPADYSGDGKTDIAFWRPSTGQWFILRSEDSSFYAFPFGTSGDVPVPADYDGDGKADAAVFRESSLTWFISKSSGGTDIIGFGAAGDKPVVGDYDGDGKADIAIFRPNGANGAEWWIRRSSNGSVFVLQFGVATDKPVQGDFTGDGKTDVAVFRPANGNWFILRSEDFSFFAFPFGTNGDVPVAGDYDGDGKFDAAVFRPSSNTWFVQRSTAGTLIQTFGIAGDLPTPNAFVP